jgi:hypothetical protein
VETHIDGEIDGLVADGFADLLDDPRCTCDLRDKISISRMLPCRILLPRTDSVDLASFDTLEPRLIVILVVCRARQCRANRAVLS